MKILINAVSAKKVAGGAFQISVNFIKESLSHTDIEWYWVVSQDLDEVLGEQFQVYRGSRYYAFPSQPDFKHSYFKVRKKLALLEKEIKPDLVYSITAPSYFFFKTTEVMRFTKPWVTHPNQYVQHLLTPKKRMEIALQKYLMRKAQFFITQSQTCKNGIVKITGVNDNQVCVVSNVLPAAFRYADRTAISVDDNYIHVACIGNPFPHKNFDILPDVLNELKKSGIENVKFHVTIPKVSLVWDTIERKLNVYDIKGRVITHGRCSQQELIDIYRRCQFCFLPTLLEVFSASAIEAMYFHLPTVATELPFNTEVFEDSCLYCEPNNAKSAADQLIQLISDKELQGQFIKKMETRLKMYGNYDDHFNSIMEFLVKAAKKQI